MRIFGSVRLGPFRFGLSAPVRRRPRARYWTHPGCEIHHRSQATADRCRNR